MIISFLLQMTKLCYKKYNKIYLRMNHVYYAKSFIFNVQKILLQNIITKTVIIKRLPIPAHQMVNIINYFINHVLFII